MDTHWYLYVHYIVTGKLWQIKRFGGQSGGRLTGIHCTYQHTYTYIYVRTYIQYYISEIRTKSENVLTYSGTRTYIHLHTYVPVHVSTYVYTYIHNCTYHTNSETSQCPQVVSIHQLLQEPEVGALYQLHG